MSFIFVGERAYENILPTKICRFTVVEMPIQLPSGHQDGHNPGKGLDKRVRWVGGAKNAKLQLRMPNVIIIMCFCMV